MVLYIYIFYGARLYSDALLQVVYVVLQVYGWYHWLHGGRNDTPLPVARLSVRHLAGWVGVGIVGAGALGYVMAHYTDAALPFWDATITSLSLVAQYLLARKKLENWLFWITVDILAIGVYAAKALYPTAGLYAVFLGLATYGFFEWKRSLPAAAPG